MRRGFDLDAVREVLARKDAEPERFAKYRNDACGFAREVVGVALTKIQQRMLLAMVANPRFAVACGQRTGRTTVLAVCLLWFAAVMPNARAILSTPSHAHMRGTIWRQLGELIRKATIPLGATWYEQPSRGIQFDNGNEIIGIASDTGERLQGYAAANLLIVVDEAAGYPETLMPALMSNLAGGGQVTIGGNPTNNTSYFAKRWSTEGWETMNISSLDVAQSDDRQPGQATPEWCAEMLAEHGGDSLLYRARVLGLFSAANANSVFTLTEIDDSFRRYDEIIRSPTWHQVFVAGGPLEFGLDVSRGRVDDTVMVGRRGNIALPPQVWKIPDLTVVAEEAIRYVNSLRSPRDGRPIVRVDGVGVGAGVVDILRKEQGITVVDVQAAGKPSRDAYSNARSESVFTCRDWVRGGGCIARNSRLEGEMAALEYSFDQRNRLRIRSKDELKKELGRSTDVFDALALAVYQAAETGNQRWIRLLVAAMRNR